MRKITTWFLMVILSMRTLTGCLLMMLALILMTIGGLTLQYDIYMAIVLIGIAAILIGMNKVINLLMEIKDQLNGYEE